MRRVLTALAVGVVGVVMAIPAQAAGGGPPFQAGPKQGDQFTQTSADPATGDVSIFQLNVRQAAAVNCAGQGPMATLETSQPADGVRQLGCIPGRSVTGVLRHGHPHVRVAPRLRRRSTLW